MNPISPSTVIDRGFYILCDDKVFGWTSRLIASIRKFHPDISIVLIPHDDAVQKLEEKFSQDKNIYTLQTEYNFYDQIGKKMLGKRLKDRYPRYRSLSAFHGPLEKFCYIDADCLILDNIEDVFESVTPDTILFNNHARAGRNFQGDALKQYANAMLGAPNGENGFNAAFIAGMRGSIPKAVFRAISRSAERIAPQLGNATDQSLISYSLLVLGLKGKTLREAIPGWPKGNGIEGVYQRDGAFWRERGESEERVKFVHWGGTKNREDIPGRELMLAFSESASQDIVAETFT